MKKYLLTIVILIMCILPIIPLSVHAASIGQITGQLLDGTTRNAPLAGQKVTLQMAQGENAQDLTTATTDANGTFTFNDLRTDKTISYAVYIHYQGAQYVSSLVSLDSNATQHLNLKVYDATASTAKVAVVDATLLMRKPDPKKGTFTLSEAFSFKNLDTHTYVGSLDASKGKPNALLFSLPSGARNISLSNGFDGYQVIQVDRGFATDAALPPGDTEFSFTFDAPYNGSTYDFGYTPMYPTVALSFLVPSDIRATSSGLTSQGVVTAEQQPYRLFKADQMLANQQVHINLEGLPTQDKPAALNTGSIWLIVGLLIMLAIMAVTASLYRFQQRLASLTTGKGKSRNKHRKNAASRSTKQTSSKQEQALLHELLELDKQFEAGKLNKTTYKERRARTKALLRSLMSEQEAIHR